MTGQTGRELVNQVRARFHSDRLAIITATWFGVGRLPWAPGTWGSLAALPFAWVIAATAGPIGLALAALALFAVGWAAAARYVGRSGVCDPKEVVVDEVAGQWLVLALAPRELWPYALGFALFRAADIVKPWPVSWADRAVKGGLGVMLDDALAAVYAGLALLFLLWIMGI